MAGPPELERANARDQNIQDEGRWPDEDRGEAAKSHHGDVAGGTGMPHGGEKESNKRDPGEEEKQVGVVQAHRPVLETEPAV